MFNLNPHPSEKGNVRHPASFNLAWTGAALKGVRPGLDTSCEPCSFIMLQVYSGKGADNVIESAHPHFDIYSFPSSNSICGKSGDFESESFRRASRTASLSFVSDSYLSDHVRL